MSITKQHHVNLLINANYGTACSNGGVSSKDCRGLILVDDSTFTFKDIPTDSPYIYLRVVRRELRNSNYDKYTYVHCEPIVENKPWFMFGGSYVTTSDSRFKEVNDYPIPLHDRVE